MTLAYDTAGHGDPPLLLLHGWCCHRGFLAPQYEYFSARQRVVAVDLPGHGASAFAGEGSMEDFADRVAEPVAALGVSGAVVVGHSLGASVALALGRDHPELVSALVLLDPAPLERAVMERALGPLVASAQEFAARRSAFVDRMFLPTDDTDRRAWIVAEMLAVPDDVAVATGQAGVRFDGVAALRACSVPVLSIGSAVPSNPPHFLRDTSPGIVIGQTVGSGHFHQLEVPEQVNPMIERFLDIAFAAVP